MVLRVWLGLPFTSDGKEKSPIIKFFDDETYAKIKEAADAQPDDLLLFAADTYEVAMRFLLLFVCIWLMLLGIERGHALLWVVNFPMFRYDEDERSKR